MTVYIKIDKSNLEHNEIVSNICNKNVVGDALIVLSSSDVHSNVFYINLTSQIFDMIAFLFRIKGYYPENSYTYNILRIIETEYNLHKNTEFETKKIDTEDTPLNNDLW